MRPRLLACLLAILLSASSALGQGFPITVELGSTPFDLEHDVPRGRFYVSLPERNEIAVISEESYTVVDRLVVGSRPRGMGMSIDGTRLLVALSGAAAVAIVDLETFDVSEIVVGQTVESSVIHRVMEVQPNRLFIVGADDFARVAELRLDTGALTKVADNEIIRVQPQLALTADRRSLFIMDHTEAFRLDLDLPGAPVTAEGRLTSLGGIRFFDVHPAGTHVLDGTGHVRETTGFTQVGTIGRGPNRFSEDGQTAFVVLRASSLGLDSVVEEFDLTTFESVGRRDLSCQFDGGADFIGLPGGGHLLLTASTLCGDDYATSCAAPPGTPGDPSPAPGALDVSVSGRLAWSSAGGGCPTHYELRLGTTNPPTDVACANATENACEVGPLEPFTTYHWQVVASNAQGTVPGPAWSFTTGAPPQTHLPTGSLLADNAWDLELDHARGLAYVSLPDLGEVHVFSSVTWEVVDTISFAGRPVGMSLSIDGSRLFVAIGDTGNVGVVDLSTRSVHLIDVLDALGHPDAYDVLEAEPGRLFVTANTRFGGFGYLAQVRLDQGEVATRVAGGEVLDRNPRLAVNPVTRTLYVGETGGTNVLYPVDLREPDAPILPEFASGVRNFGLRHMVVSQDGSRVYLQGGDILRSDSFLLAGVIDPDVFASGPVPALGAAADRFHLARRATDVETYDARTLRPLQRVEVLDDELQCRFVSSSGIRELRVLEGDVGFASLANDKLCVVTSDIDVDGSLNDTDNCLHTANPGQEDGDADGVGDACDVCPLLSDPGQPDRDGDGIGDLCDLFPDAALRVRTEGATHGVPGQPVTITYRLEDRRDGRLLSELAKVRVAVTLGGSATFGTTARRGLLVDGGGTSRAVIEFVNGLVTLEVRGGATPESVALGIEDDAGRTLDFLPGIFENFEESDGGFERDASAEWQLGFPNSGPRMTASGSRLWGTNLEGRAERGIKWVASPQYWLPAESRPVLRFESWRDVDSRVEISVDGGATWELLQLLFTNRETFETVEIDLAEYAGQSVRIRFYQSVTSSLDEGWYVDDFELAGPGAAIDFLAPSEDPDGDGLTNLEELIEGTNPRSDDSDLDGIADLADNCPAVRNPDQADTLHVNGIGDACDDPDGDGVADLFDNCLDSPNADQANPDGDLRGEVCDAHPGVALEVRADSLYNALTSAARVIAFRLQDRRDGALLSELQGIRAVLTVDGNATIDGVAGTGTLISGAGTQSALVEFDEGLVELAISSAVPGVVALGGSDPDDIDLRIVTRRFDDFEDGDGGWVPSAAIIDIWEWGEPLSGPRAAFSGSKVWGTRLEGNPRGNTRGFLVSPALDIPIDRAPVLRFQSWLEGRTGQFGGVRVGPPGGATGGLGGPSTGPNPPRYELLEFDLAVHAGREVAVGLRLDYSGTSPGAGWYVDDIHLVGTGTIEFLDPSLDHDLDGLDNEAELAQGSNPRQADTDFDGVSDLGDNCPLVRNPGQEDTVRPGGTGDACDDPDGDMVADLTDNCPDVFNPDQRDEVHPNGVGDACEDPDLDGVVDLFDNCPDRVNGDQTDQDADGVGDTCDICVATANPAQLENAACIVAPAEANQCLEAQVELVNPMASGEVSVLRLDTQVPDRLSVDFLARSCEGVEFIDVALNGVVIDSVALDPAQICDCNAGRMRVELGNASSIAQAWNPGGPNRVSLEKTPGDARVMWAESTLTAGNESVTQCFPLGPADCGFEISTCLPLGSASISQEVEIAGDPFSTGTAVGLAPFAEGMLPGLVSIEGLTPGPADLCVAETDVTRFYASNREGGLFRLDPVSATATPVGQLPSGTTEIEFDAATGTGYLHESGSSTRAFRFDLGDGSALGGAIDMGSVFNGVEQIEGVFYGVAQAGSILMRFDPLAATTDAIGPTGRRSIAGLAWDPNTRVLYGIDGGGGPASLLSLDLATGAATEIGSVGFQTGSLEFGPDGVLYGGGTGPHAGQLYRLDPATATSALVGDTGLSSLTGLATVTGLAISDCARFDAQGTRRVAINGTCDLPVEIEIRPGRFERRRDRCEKEGSVVFFGAPGFDTQQIDPKSLRFGPEDAKPRHRKKGHSLDVDGDGEIDRVHSFRIRDSGLERGDRVACVRGAMRDGTPFESCDERQAFVIETRDKRGRKPCIAEAEGDE